MQKIRAAVYERTGPAPQVLSFREIELPELSGSDVLIRMEASSINPHDVLKRKGLFGNPIGPKGYVIPGEDGVGIITAVGGDVPANRVGERVWFSIGGSDSDFGTAASCCIAPANRAIKLPDGIKPEVGAALGVPAMTAWYALFVSERESLQSKTVLIHGGGGSTGTLGIQLAKWYGARVIATASSAKAKLARDAGADFVVDYRSKDPDTQILKLSGGTGVDRIVDVAFGENIDMNVAAIKVGGTIVTLASPGASRPTIPVFDLIFKDIRIHFLVVYAMGEAIRRQAYRDITACLALGILRPLIDSVVPLDTIASAHQKVEEGKANGNIILLPPKSS